MKIGLLFGMLAACLAICYARYKASDFTADERMEAAVQGIKEAKEIRAEKDKAIAAKAKTQSKKDTSAEYLARFFRKASKQSVKMGKARIMLEDAVKRAERILLEKKRAQMASAASVEEEAEMLAEEIFHTPGSLLTKDDLAHIYSEIPECLDRREEIDCLLVPFADVIRTIDGTCNNLEKPTRGASFTPFQRVLPGHFEDGLQQPHGFWQSKMTDNMFRNGPFTPPYPSARLISSTVVLDRLGDDPNLTHLVMQWGQFLDHDLDLVVEVSPEEAQCDTANCTCTDVCFPIRVPQDDEAFGVDEPRQGECLPFARTVPACELEDFEARDQLNELTHYIDGSMIYGSTDERAKFLREFKDGRLKVGDAFPTDGGNPSLPEISAFPPCPPFELTEGELPPSERCCPEGRDSCFVAGDVRVNEQVSLTVMHTIWVREHNRIAAELARLNLQWDDERIYQETRKIVIAEVQQITFDEFLPALFGKEFFDKLIGPYIEYQPDRDASVPTAFATAAFRFGHSLIQNEFQRLDNGFNSIAAGSLNLRDAFMNPQAYFDSQGTDPIVRGWITQPARALDEFLNSVLTTQLFETEEGLGMDLATLNIQRSRDHGLPPYPIWKKFCQNRFGSDLPEAQFSNELTKIRFLQTYGALDTVDLWVGGLAEEPIPGGVIGPTFACIFAITFSDLRFGDRFWYENGIFTADQLAEIKRTSLARVLCDNADALSTIQPNPFMVGSRRSCFLSISGINFQPWVEDPLCYQRIRIEPHARDVKFYFLSVIASDDVRQYPLNRPGPSTSRFEVCVPFECPTATRNTQIVNFPADIPDDTNFRECRVTANNGLPANRAPRGSESVYFGIWNEGTVQASSGLHKDLGSCQSSTIVAMTFVCPPSTKLQSAMRSDSDLEHELARILQTGGGGGSVNTSLTFLAPFNVSQHANELPEVVRNLLKNPPSLSVLQGVSATGTDSSKVQLSTEKKTSSDKQATKEGNTDQLVHLLEETLNELKGH